MYFSCKPLRTEIYINSQHKDAQSIKNELGCDILLNGGIFDLNTLIPYCWLKVKGNIIASADWSDFGLCWNSDEKLMFDTSVNIGKYLNFISCVAMIKDSQRLNMIYPPEMGNRRGRTAIGLKDNGELIAFCSKDGTPDAVTPEELQEKLYQLGAKDVIMFDCGTSSSCIMPNGTIESSRSNSPNDPSKNTIHNFIAIWIDKSNQVSNPQIPKEKEETTIIQGIDTASPLKEDHIRRLVDNDISFVGRYLVPPSATMWKALTQDEITRIRDAGLAILLCWEIGAGDMKQGSSKGIQHGSTARQLAESYGVPAGTTIFFACDYNAQRSDYIQIEAYLQGAALSLGDKYNVGLYGHANLIDYIARGGIVKKFWQCVAWSDSRVSSYTNVYQYQGSDGTQAKVLRTKVGVPVDLNSCHDMKAAGLWLPPVAEKPWYEDSMKLCEQLGLMTDGRPNDFLTRAEASMIIARMYEKKYGAEDYRQLGGLIADDWED